MKGLRMKYAATDSISKSIFWLLMDGKKKKKKSIHAEM